MAHETTTALPACVGTVEQDGPSGRCHVAGGPGFTSYLVWRNGAALRVEATGDLCTASVPPLLERVDELMEWTGAHRVELDLRRVAFADARAISGIEILSRSCVSGGATLEVVDVSPAVERLMRLCGCTSMLGRHDATRAPDRT